jgi:hypothetical protein
VRAAGAGLPRVAGAVRPATVCGRRRGTRAVAGVGWKVRYGVKGMRGYGAGSKVSLNIIFYFQSVPLAFGEGGAVVGFAVPRLYFGDVELEAAAPFIVRYPTPSDPFTDRMG